MLYFVLVSVQYYSVMELKNYLVSDPKGESARTLSFIQEAIDALSLRKTGYLLDNVRQNT